MRSDLALHLSALSGIPLTDNLEKYLGFPFIHGRLMKDMFKEVFETVKNWLEG